jgi:hypothetical protein
MNMLSRFFAVAVAGVLICQSGASGQTSDPESPHFRRHQFVLGGGNGMTFERDVFNTRSNGIANAAKVDPALRLAYHYNFNDNWSAGVIIHGYQDEFENTVTGSGNTTVAKFKLNTSNQGIVVQRYLNRGNIQPYVYAAGTFANGTVTASTESNPDAELEYEGFTIGLGAGVLVVVAKYLGLSLDGIFSGGTAEWDQRPFTNSENKEFTPSYNAITLNLVLLIP